MSDNSQSNTTKLLALGLGLTASAAASYYIYTRYIDPPLSFIEAFNEGDIKKSHITQAVKAVQAPNPPHGINQENLLQLACRHGNVAAITQLLPHFRNKLRDINIFGCNILHLCVNSADNVEALRVVSEHILTFPHGGRLYEDLLNAITNEKSWTPLHIAAATGRTKSTRFLLEFAKKHSLHIALNLKDQAGHTPLVMAACNGHLEIVQELLKNPDVNIYLTNSRCKSCLFFACFNSHEEIVHEILEFEKNSSPQYFERNCEQKTRLVNIPDFAGNFPLHACALRANVNLIQVLLDNGAQLNVVSNAGDSVLNICCQRNDPKHNAVLEYLTTRHDLFEEINVLLDRTTTFGCNPLHDACFSGNVTAMKFLLENRNEFASKWLLAQDNDGLTPFHTLCRGFNNYKAKKIAAEDLFATLRLLLDYGCDPNVKDYADSTVLHFLCYNPPDDRVILQVVETVLAAGADPTYEDTFGWTPLHAIVQTSKAQIAKEIRQVIRDYIQKKYPDYLENFDENKPRNVGDRTFVDRSGPHNRIPIEERNQVLDQNFTIDGIAKYIRARQASGNSFKIVVMVGAGISVNCGIPDFRSPNTGIYSTINPGQFSLEYLVQDPVGFYDIARDIFGGIFNNSVHPSDTHYFLKLLADKGLLQRVYTQNIDTLEKIAGVPSDLIVEAHGSFSSARCVNCSKPFENIEEYWKLIFDHQIPTCSACSFIVRPDVVFFGEGMPERFFQLHQSDFRQADLLIVMGTSLMVFPFASLVSMVGLLTPRLLINKNKVGTFAKVDSPNNYRDVAFDGDCDEGVRQLVDALGWTDDLLSVKNAAKSQ